MKKRLGLYIDPSTAPGLGGASTACAVIAEHLRRRFDVELVVRSPEFDLEELARASATDLSGVRTFHHPQLAGQWPLRVPRRYDVFFACVHLPPPICAAPRGVLYTLFPAAKQTLWPWSNDDGRATGARRLFRLAWHEHWFRQRLAGYRSRLAISEFTRQWTSARWGFDSDVLFPPVDTSAQILSKEKLIVSVGRFHGGGGVNKGQLEMLRAFAKLRERNSSTLDWRYVCVGGLGTRSDDQQYFSACLAEAAHCGAELIANASPAVVKELYGRASIFWHAAGIGKDEKSTPELLEHFGMVTAEAMAHGAVPVVIAKGGQCEIVQDGTTGLLWHSEADLVEGTFRLIEQPEELALLGERAKAAAERYSRASFCESLDRLVPILA